jgi:uncharacterized protein YbaR (Trm112 family)
MYIELLDLLRCPRDHEETWLVAAFMRMEGRYLITGRLGCPVCSASYPVENGIADLRVDADAIQPASDKSTFGDESAVRIAAMLGLTRPDSLIALTGDEVALADQVSEIAEARVIALNPPTYLQDSERVARVLSAGRIPLASASIEGIVMTSENADLGEAVRLLRPGARLVLRAGASVPPMFRELARDDDYIVAESSGPMVQLSR